MIRLSLAVTLAALLFACSDSPTEEGELLAPAEVRTGNLSLEWTFSVEGDALDCHSLGIGTMDVIMVSDSAEYTESLDCGAGTAETGDVPAGRYEVSVAVYDRSVEMMDSMPVDTVVVEADATTPLGWIQIAMDGLL